MKAELNKAPASAAKPRPTKDKPVIYRSTYGNIYAFDSPDSGTCLYGAECCPGQLPGQYVNGLTHYASGHWELLPPDCSVTLSNEEPES